MLPHRTCLPLAGAIAPAARADAGLGVQELKRGLNALTNFGMSFSIVSFLTSITGSFGIAWFWGARRRVRETTKPTAQPAFMMRVLPPAWLGAAQLAARPY